MTRSQHVADCRSTEFLTDVWVAVCRKPLEMLVSDQQFSRADWRPGKRRKRVKRMHNWGGAKVANAAFLRIQSHSGEEKGVDHGAAA